MAEDLKATLTVDGKSVDMSDKAGVEKLVGGMIRRNFGMAEGITVEIGHVIIGGIKVKEDKDAGPMMVFDVGAKLDIATMARLWNLKRSGPIRCQFTSPQGVMDLKIQTVNLSTGEVKPFGHNAEDEEE